MRGCEALESSRVCDIDAELRGIGLFLTVKCMSKKRGGLARGCEHITEGGPRVNQTIDAGQEQSHMAE